MGDHPIEGLMTTAMNSIKDMIDVDTIIGEAIVSGNGTTIIPISRVTFGFAAGGSEFKGETKKQYNKAGMDEDISYKLPFGGGSGAGVKIAPVAFLVITDSGVKLLPVDHCSSLDKLLDYVPDLIDKISELFDKTSTTTYEYNFYDGEGPEEETTESEEENNEEDEINPS